MPSGYLELAGEMVFLMSRQSGALSIHADRCDVYASCTIVDRGELDKLETALPIFDGGFDQQQVVVGAEYRLEPRHRQEDPGG
jgi:hypothetical protein